MTAVLYLRKSFPLKARPLRAKGSKLGFAQERTIKDTIEKNDATAVVVKSARSHGPFDLLAIVPSVGVIIGIQSKRDSTGRGGNKWDTPFESFGNFVPVLLRRLPKTWEIKVSGDKSAKDTKPTAPPSADGDGLLQ